MFELTPGNSVENKNAKSSKNAKGKNAKQAAPAESTALIVSTETTPPVVAPAPIESVVATPIIHAAPAAPVVNADGMILLTPEQFLALQSQRAARKAAPLREKPAPRQARPAFNLRGDIFNTPDGKFLPIRQVAEIGWKRADGKNGIWNPRKIGVRPIDSDIVIQDSYHIVRDDYPADDSRRFISTGRGVGEGYTLTSNDEIIAFCEAITNGVAQGCGAFFNGSIVYIAVNLVGDCSEIVDEGLENYLIVSTSHDGTRGYLASLCPFLPTCFNSFSYSTAAAKTSWMLRHNESITARLALVSQVLNDSKKSFVSVRDDLRKLASVKISQATAKQYLEKLFPNKKRTDEVDGNVIAAKRNRILELFNGAQDGAALTSRKDTLFGLVMAVSQREEREGRVILNEDARTGAVRDENEVLADRILFKGQDFRSRAMEIAMQVADAN